MISVIIATSNDERPLVATLAALVPAAMAGVVKDVVVADRRSGDATAAAAEAAGCAVLVTDDALATRLKAAANAARGDWLLFLRPGVVLDATWPDAASRFAQDAAAGRTAATAATFAAAPAGFATPGVREAMRALRAALAPALPSPDQGLLIAKRSYQEMDGHRGGQDPETDLIARLGRRIAVLRAAARMTD